MFHADFPKVGNRNKKGGIMKSKFISELGTVFPVQGFEGTYLAAIVKHLKELVKVWENIQFQGAILIPATI